MKTLITPAVCGLVTFLLAACAIGTSTPAAAKPLCESKGEMRNGELRHGGRDRQYRIHIPEAASEESPVPVIVALHGGWGTGDAMADQSGLTDAAARQGMAVVYPNGIWRSWNAGSCCGRAQSGGVDDVGFIRALVEKLSEEDCIDGARVFGTGFSNGAMMTHRIACEAPDVYRAIAPVAGGPMFEDCASEQGVPALLMVGREDERIPWDGGEFNETYRPSIAEQVRGLASRNRCEEDDEKSLAHGCKGLSGCGQGEVRWCVFDRIGHQWPGGSTILPRMLGANRSDIDATRMIVDFFDEQR